MADFLLALQKASASEGGLYKIKCGELCYEGHA
jgi:hypothetical protein